MDSVADKKKGVIFAAANEGNEGDEKRGGFADVH